MSARITATHASTDATANTNTAHPQRGDAGPSSRRAVLLLRDRAARGGTRPRHAHRRRRSACRKGTTPRPAAVVSRALPRHPTPPKCGVRHRPLRRLTPPSPTGKTRLSAKRSAVVAPSGCQEVPGHATSSRRTHRNPCSDCSVIWGTGDRGTVASSHPTSGVPSSRSTKR